MSYAESVAEIGEMQKSYFDKLSSNLKIIEENIKNRGVVLTYEPTKKTKPLYCDIGIPKK